MKQKKTIFILTAAVLAVLILFPSCLTIDPSSIRDTEIQEVTIEELAKMFEEKESESSEKEGLTLEELLIEEGIDPAEADSIEEKAVEDTTDASVDTNNNSGEEMEAGADEAYDPADEKVEIEGASVLSDGVLMPIDEWLDAQEITEESAMLKPLDFVEAADLPIEATGKVIEPAEEIEVSSPETVDEVYQPEVTIVSSTATTEELDILSEYEKFLAEYGDYTEAESDTVDESTINDLFTVPPTPAFTSAPEQTLSTAETVEEEVVDTSDTTLSEPSEIEWVDVPVEDVETNSIEEAKEESTNFFLRLWNKIKTFFVNTWKSIKNWFSVISAPKTKG